MAHRELPSDSIAVPQQGTPECVLTWVRRPGGGIRLYASRDLRNQSWGQQEWDSAVNWHVRTTLANVLIVDRETPAEAIQWVLERWMREDAAEQQRIASLKRHAIEGHTVNDPRAVSSVDVPGGQV